jgi:hypothetical protein
MMEAMAKVRLTLVPPEAEKAPATAADRIRLLQAEAQTLAREEIDQLNVAMVALARQAEEIAGGGEAYPVGARELARRLVDEVGQRAQTLQAILHKA